MPLNLNTSDLNEIDSATQAMADFDYENPVGKLDSLRISAEQFGVWSKGLGFSPDADFCGDDLLTRNGYDVSRETIQAIVDLFGNDAAIPVDPGSLPRGFVREVVDIITDLREFLGLTDADSQFIPCRDIPALADLAAIAYMRGALGSVFPRHLTKVSERLMGMAFLQSLISLTETGPLAKMVLTNLGAEIVMEILGHGIQASEEREAA